MVIGIVQLLGIVLTVTLIIGAGILGSRKVNNAEAFIIGSGESSCAMVVGALMGSLVSGQATVGTAQLAFNYGISACWFTLGAGIGCLVLAIGYAAPLRRSGCITLMEIAEKEYGKKAEYLGSVFSSVGIFISVIAQIMSSVALLTSVFNVGIPVAAAVSVLIMSLYVVTGGSAGTGIGGIIKLVLLYVSGIAAFIIALGISGGLSPAITQLSQFLIGSPLGNSLHISSYADFADRYLNIVARGVSTDIGSGISLILGVIATQTYAQAIWSGKTTDASRKGAIIAALVTPPIGLACIYVGMFMRSRCVTAAELETLTAAGVAVSNELLVIANSSQVFPMFIIHYMPKLLGGIALGTLLITNVAGGAGLSLGTATILANNIYFKLKKRSFTGEERLVRTRVLLLLVLLAAAVIASTLPGATINDFGFMSMGLRGAGVFLPISCALFLPGRIRPKYVMAAMVAGPVVVLISKLLGTSIDPLFFGVGAAALIMLCGFRRAKCQVQA